MPEFSGEPRHVGPVAILVSRYNELVTRRLLDGAMGCAHDAGMTDEEIDIVWVPGAFELGTAAAELAASGRYSAIVALGAVVRGETPHFDYVAGETARALSAVGLQHLVPVGFGVLTVDSMEQALDRAGGKAGNKGQEAMSAALELADVMRLLRERP